MPSARKVAVVVDRPSNPLGIMYPIAKIIAEHYVLPGVANKSRHFIKMHQVNTKNSLVGWAVTHT